MARGNSRGDGNQSSERCVGPVEENEPLIAFHRPIPSSDRAESGAPRSGLALAAGTACRNGDAPDTRENEIGRDPVTPRDDGGLRTWLEERGAYAVRFARNAADRRSVQALRYEVFARELGARVEGADRGLDLDPLDERADHLMVVHRESSECVGSYRLATLEQVADEGFYTERIFELDRLPPDVRHEGVELGRACVALAHRNRGVLQLLLRGIGAYLVHAGKRFAFGCGSVGLKDEAQSRLALAEIEAEGWLDPDLAVAPTPAYRPAWPESQAGARPEIPALLYAYCAIGARLACAPAWDPDFRTLDFFVLLDLERVDPRTYARYCGKR
ncbi:MAG: GNAT family N-acetyltransferase [bacterium]|nr:GNAT family N-acetyltransferase [bacterium]